MPEIVGIRLHRQAEHSDDAMLLCHTVVTVGAAVAVVTGTFQHLVGNEVLARTVTLHNGGHHLLRHIGIVGQQLLGILR